MSIFLSHLLAWVCGSIIRGQRADFCARMALSSETASLGKSFSSQFRIRIWLPSVFDSEYFGEISS